jgi:hypothetical protein
VAGRGFPYQGSVGGSWGLRVFAFVLGVGVARTARAAEPSAADRETSRALYAQGMQALDAHEYASAERACGGAHALVKAPTSAACWARALEAVGRLVEARDVFLEAAHFPVASDEPTVFTRARAASRAEADAIAKRIPSLTVVVRGPADASKIRVSIDGTSVPPETVLLPRKVNPGARQVTVVARGFEPSTVDVQVAEAEDRRVEVTLRGEANAAPAETAPAPRGKPPPALALVAGGVGVTGLALGVVAGLVGQSRHSTLAGECNGSVCPPSAQGEIDSFHAMRTISTTGYVVGAMGLVGGAVLWITTASSDGSAVGVQVAPTSARLVGRF